MTMHRWRDAFSPSEVVQRIRPEAVTGELRNPHRGWTTFQRFAGDPLAPDMNWNDAAGPVAFSDALPESLVPAGDFPAAIAYCRWPWGVLEPERGRIRFGILDRAIAAAQRRGQTLQLRVQPFVYNDLPAWFVASGARLLAQATRDAGSIAEPDANDPLYVRHWSDFIRALGQRYDGHPGLESVDMAYAGRFGEMGGNATPETAATLIEAYLAAFPRTMLLSMISTAGCRYASGVKTRPIGWRGDGFIDDKNKGRGAVPDRLCWNHMWDVYPVDIFDYGVADAWLTAPVTLEPINTLQHVAAAGWEIEEMLDACLRYHPSVFMHKSVRVPEKWMEPMAAFVAKLGYRFHLHQMTLPLEARPGQEVRTTVTIDNRGVAPLYRPYVFALRFSQDGRHAIVPFRQDVRAWRPGYASFHETFPLPATLRPGEAKASCAIVDQGRPVVRLAIQAVDSEGWHPLTSIDVRH